MRWLAVGLVLLPSAADAADAPGTVVFTDVTVVDAEAGKLVPLDVKKGEKVMFGKWSGTEVKINGVDLLIMKESDIMGVIGK